MRFYILLILLFFSTVAIQAQAPIITAGQETVLEGGTVNVPVSVTNFNDVVSIQFTLQWDPAVVTYQNTGDYGLPGMSEFNFGETDIANGRLTFVWFDGQVNGFTLPDDSVIFSVTFLAVGDLGDSSPVSFVNAPTPIQIGVINGVLIEEIDGTYIDGEVQIISETLQVATSTTSNTCFGESQGSITTNVEGGLPTYVFNWTGPDGFISSDPNIDNLAAGDYALTITDQNGTTYEDDFVVSEPPAIQVDNIQLQESNCDTPTGSIMLTVSGGAPDYLYDFGDGFSPDAVENQLAAGNYLVQIQDDSNCIIDTLITISESGAPEIMLEDDFSICPDDSATLTASTDATLSYSWTLDGLPITPTINEITITETGIYAVSATNAAGCTAVDQVTVNESMVPQAELGQDLELCANDETTLTASTTDNLTYSWTLDGQPFPQTTNEITISVTGIYAVTVTNDSGCIATDQVTITEVAAPLIELGSDFGICPEEETTLSASDDQNLTYNWTFEGQPLTETTNEISVNTVGTYAVSATNAAGCTSTDQITINADAVPVLELGEDIGICPDGATTLSAGTDPTFVYSWTLDGQPIAPTTNEITITETGLYAVSATNAAGCTALDQVTVSESMIPEAELGQDLELCANDETTLTASTADNLTYSWTLDGQPFPQTTNEITISVTGIYAVTVTNDSGCTATDQVTITGVAAPLIELGNDFGICPEEETTLSASEDQNLTYSWTFEGQPLTETTNEISVNTVGTYAVSATNAAGCTSTDQITINADAVPVLELGEDIGICPDGATTLSAGTDPTFVYSWTLDGQPIAPTTNEITVTETGLYTVSASNDAGCTAADEVIVSDAILPLLDLGPDTSICPKTTLVLLANEDLMTFNWTVDGEPAGTDAPELLVSNEGLVVLDALSEDGCTLSDTIAISLIPFPTTVGPDTTIFSGQPLTLFAEGGIAYNWMTNVELSCTDCPDPEVTLDETTTLLVDITSSEGCVVTETLTVNVEEAPEVLVDLVNFLSPNGDGKNDVLIFRGLENYRGNQLSIFNRWGDLIFSKPNYQIDGEYWDGTWNGQPLPPGIYYYVLNIDVASKPIKSALTIVID